MRWLPLLLLACNDPSEDPGLIDGDGDGFPAERDCDDRDPGIYPGATDSWYDGVDSDCDGRDDYDQDEDGAQWEVHGGTDCDDLDPAIGPHAVEVPYDLVDNDCDDATPENDLDGDGSRFPVDCDDLDPTIGEGFPERFGDGVDEDCDGQIDGSPLQPTPHQFTRPRHLRIATDPDGEPVVVLAADEITGHAGGRVEASVGVALWPTRDDPAGVVFQGGDDGDGDGMGGVAVAADDEALWFGASVTVGATGQRRLALHRFQTFGTELLRVESRAYDSGLGEVFPTIDVAIDRAGEPWGVMGGAEGLVWTGGPDGAGGADLDADASAGVAMLTAVPPMPALSCSDAGCTRWATADTDAPPEVQGDPPLDGPARTLVRGGEMLLLVNDGFGAIAQSDDRPHLLLPEWPLLHGAGWHHEGVLYAGGVTTDDLVVVTWGNPDFAEPAVTQFALSDLDWVPIEVAVWADDDRFVVAVLGDYAPAKPVLLQDRLFVAVLERADF